MRLFNKIGAKYFIKRYEKQVSPYIERPIEHQEQIFKSLMKSGRQTIWGKEHHYQDIKGYRQYTQQVPIQSYDSLKPYIERVMKGEHKVLWSSKINWFAKSSGTTSDKSKFIPVSKEALKESHIKGGKDILSIYCQNNPETNMFSGKGLVMGGSHQVNKLNKDTYYGDVSAVIINNLPFWSQLIKTPDLETALLADWEKKIDKMARITMEENVTNVVGVPTWTIVLFNKIIELTGKNNILEVWPELELYTHGGVSFKPYKEQFQSFIPSDLMKYVETYNASEGFFGIKENNTAEDMLLLTDHGIFYEFVPFEEIGSDNPNAIPLNEVEVDKNYAIVITTNSGLWRYMIGDTVKFTSTKPYKIVITGRTKSFINAFGEEVIEDNATKALLEACKQTGTKIKEYTAGPIYIEGQQKGGHEWLIEFETTPADMEFFTKILDQALQSINSDYEAKRFKNMALEMPKVHNLPEGTFYNWLKKKGKLGGQHKVPKLCNDRKYIDDILKLTG